MLFHLFLRVKVFCWCVGVYFLVRYVCQLVEAWLEIDVRIEGFISTYDNSKLLQINLIEKNTLRRMEKRNAFDSLIFLHNRMSKCKFWMYIWFSALIGCSIMKFLLGGNDVGCILKQLNVDVNKKMLLIR